MQLGVPLTVIFATAAREPARNNGCGPFVIKILEITALYSTGIRDFSVWLHLLDGKAAGTKIWNAFKSTTVSVRP